MSANRIYVHAKALSLDLDDLDLARAEKTMQTAHPMSRENVRTLIERKQAAIRLLRIEQAALLAVLEEKSR